MHRCNNANFSYFLNVSSRNHPHEGNLRLMTMVFSTVVNTIFLIATVLFNGMICLAVFKDKSLRTSSNALLVSLSIADLLTIVEFAGNIVLAHTGGAWCSYIAQYHYFVTSLTIVHLAAISLDRLLAIKWHLRYQSLVTNCRMVAAILFIWILLLLLNVLPILILSEDSHAEMDDFKKILTGCAETELTCKRKWHEKKKQNSNLENWDKDMAIETAKKHLIYGLVLNFALPFFFIVFFYSWLLKISKTHHKKISVQLAANGSKNRQELRGAKTVAIIIVCFLLCFAPMFVISTVQAFTRPCWKKRKVANKICSQVSSLSAALNPVIYSWRNEGFRNVFKRILRVNYGHVLCFKKSNSPNEDGPERQPRVHQDRELDEIGS